MENIFVTSYASTIGILHIASTHRGICKLALPNESRRSFLAWLERSFPNPDIQESQAKNHGVINELDRYFRQRLAVFHSPIHLIGSDFQVNVWNELRKIRYGSTWTYKELAERVGMPGAFQAVGRANAENPVPILIPCHRVLGKNNRLTGYGGGIKTKEFLLRLEGALLL